MKLVSIPYELSGRREQKARTKETLARAARELVAQGLAPTVEAAAERAGISRTTAYRYFPNRRALLAAAHPETGVTSLLPDDAPDDPAARLDLFLREFARTIERTEEQQRTMLRLSLEMSDEERANLPLRQGRAIAWIADALEPIRGRLTDAELHRLVLAIRSAIGIEALVWLTDIGGLSRDEAFESMRWTAQAMLQQALAGQPPGPTSP